MLGEAATDTDAREPRIPIACKNLDGTIRELHQSLDQLETRLRSVRQVRPPPPTETVERLKEVRTTLVEQIQGSREAVDAARGRVQLIINELEV